METDAHRGLKRLAVGWLRARGCQAVALEVRCPISRYRADVAGYLDRVPPLRTVVVECKQSRSDFLRDVASKDTLLAERRELQSIRDSLERQVMRDEPQLRRDGTSLFPALDEWDFESSRRTSYRRLVRRLRRLDKRLHGETKFCMMSRYRLADQLYLAAPRGMIRGPELPGGWGLLEMRGDPPRLEMIVEAPVLGSRADFQQRLLRNIAVAASFAGYSSNRREYVRVS
jgi:hypothetical protein